MKKKQKLVSGLYNACGDEKPSVTVLPDLRKIKVNGKTVKSTVTSTLSENNEFFGLSNGSHLKVKLKRPFTATGGQQNDAGLLSAEPTKVSSSPDGSVSVEGESSMLVGVLTEEGQEPENETLPNFLNNYYNVQHTSSSTMINLNIEDLEFILPENRKLNSFIFNMSDIRICPIHKIVGCVYTNTSSHTPTLDRFCWQSKEAINPIEQPDLFQELYTCTNCVNISSYQRTFNLITTGSIYTYYPPVLWMKMQFSQFISMVKLGIAAKECRQKMLHSYLSGIAPNVDTKLNEFSVETQKVFLRLVGRNDSGGSSNFPGANSPELLFKISNPLVTAQMFCFRAENNVSLNSYVGRAKIKQKKSRIYFCYTQLEIQPKSCVCCKKGGFVNLTKKMASTKKRNATSASIKNREQESINVDGGFEEFYTLMYQPAVTPPNNNRQNTTTPNNNGQNKKSQQIKFETNTLAAVPCNFAIQMFDSNETSNLPFTAPLYWTEKERNVFGKIISHVCVAMKHEKDFTESCCKFNKGNFKHGTIPKIRGGKESFVRNRILGTKANALRFTITIDSTLAFDHISIPSSFIDSFPSATPYMLMNRAPSILKTNLVAVSVLFHTDPNDLTCHVNAFVIEGMHLNQDGDEVNLYYIAAPKKHQLPTLEMKFTNLELLNITWRYGRRHNLFYEPKYSFSPFHKFIMQKHEAFLNKRSHLWRKLGDTTSVAQKCKTIMALGCSIMRDQVNDFIDLILAITQQSEGESLNVFDYILNTGRLRRSIVGSGAKGDEHMINLYYEKLNLKDNSKFLSQHQNEGFDENVNRGKKLSDRSIIQTAFYNSMNGVVYENGKILLNGKPIFERVSKSPMFANMFYNRTAVKFVMDDITGMVEGSCTKSDLEGCKLKRTK